MERRNVLCWGLGTCVLSAVLSLPLAAQSAPSAGYALENGDVNGDQERDLSDPVYLLGYLFLGSEEPVPLALCGSEATETANGDSNGDGTIDVSDPILLLGWLFSGGPAPIAACGEGFGAGGNPNPRVIPLHARPHGKSYGEWNQAWWEWNFAIPRDRNPVADTTGAFCAEGQSGPVWFLAGSFGGNVVRHCTVPPGKTLFFPVLNTIVWVPRRGNTEEEIRAFAFARMNSATRLEVTIDGVPAQDIASYLADSDAFTLVLPPNDVTGLGPATFFPAVAVGYSLMVTPLTPGEHTIHIAAASTFPGPFALDITYHLTVGP